MTPLAEQLHLLIDQTNAPVGVVLVDHGSRRGESNDLLHDVCDMFRRHSQLAIVEAAHMELAEPTVAQAFAACVEQGAKTVVVFPYFLSPGRHWSEDIPRLAAQAAANHPGVAHLVTAPLGLHPLIAEVIANRISTCLAHHTAEHPVCDLCEAEARCQLR